MGTVAKVLTLLLFLVHSNTAPTPTDQITHVTVSGSNILTHGKPNMLCVPTTATDVLVFFANYIAHAATAKLKPGANRLLLAILCIRSLLYPVEGINNAFNSIYRWCWRRLDVFPYFTADVNSLETAKRAGALVMVGRTDDWTPRPGDRPLRDLRRENHGETPFRKDNSCEDVGLCADGRGGNTADGSDVGRDTPLLSWRLESLDGIQYAGDWRQLAAPSTVDTSC